MGMARRRLAEGIAWMIDNGPLIEDRIRSAQDYIASVYSPEHIGLQWEKILEKAQSRLPRQDFSWSDQCRNRRKLTPPEARYAVRLENRLL